MGGTAEPDRPAEDRAMIDPYRVSDADIVMDDDVRADLHVGA